MASTTLRAGVTAPVDIVRDRAGVPHIYATTTPDLYFGLGFAMGEDRLWQMDRLRRRALGRQAEVMGRGYLASDIAHRTVGIPAIATSEAAAIDPASAVLVAALVAGINHAIASLPLPPEFGLLGYTPEPFTPRCVIAIARGIWWSLNGRIDRLSAAEAARFMPEAWREDYLTPEASEHLILPAPAFSRPQAAGTDDATGSNNWALGPARTGGPAILAGDPHQPFWVPSSWYEFALHGPEDDAAGAGHPGIPGLMWASNRHIAYSLTNNAASTRDLYAETVNPANPDEYRDGDGWKAFGSTTETIRIKGEPDHSLTIRHTVRGPIINALVPTLAEAGDKPLSLVWVGAGHIDDMRALINLSRATDFASYRRVLHDWAVPVFNWCFADAAGNIGYQMAGRIPLRPRFTYGYRDAANPADSWTGFVPFAHLPYSFNPPRGYTASANQRVTPPNQAPSLYGAYSQGHRGIRIDALFADQRVDQTAAIAAQNDVVNVRAATMVPAIRALLPADDAVAAALAGWDFAYTTDSIAPTVFETFMYHFQRATLSVHMPARLIDLVMQQTGLACTLLLHPDRAYFPEGTQAAARAAATAAIAALRARLGPDSAAWTWGAVHIAHWKHPLSSPATAAEFDIGPAPVDGGSHTIRNTGGEMPPHTAFSGAEYRIVVDFRTPGHFLAVQNIGNSGVPGSPHYRDQFGPWLRGEYHTVQLDRAAIDVERTTTLAP